MNYLQSDKHCPFTNQSLCVIATQTIIKEGMTASEKVDKITFALKRRVFYDYIRALKYSKDSISYEADIDGCWKSRLGLCLDFAGIFAAMCRANGIPCKIVTGTAINTRGAINHAWNEVLVENNEWRLVDVTAIATSTKVKEYRKKNEF